MDICPCLDKYLYPLRLMSIMGSIQAVVALTFERYSAITRRVWEGGVGSTVPSILSLQVLGHHGTSNLQIFPPRHPLYSRLRSGIQYSKIFRSLLSLRAEYFRTKTQTIHNSESEQPSSSLPEINKPSVGRVFLSFWRSSISVKSAVNNVKC